MRAPLHPDLVDRKRMWTIVCIVIAIVMATTLRLAFMRTIQMTLDEDLVEAVDKAARRLGKSRSAFTREALRAALRRLREWELDRKHKEGYRRHPVGKDEFSVWTAEQAWGDE